MKIRRCCTKQERINSPIFEQQEIAPFLMLAYCQNTDTAWASQLHKLKKEELPERTPLPILDELLLKKLIIHKHLPGLFSLVVNLGWSSVPWIC